MYHKGENVTAASYGVEQHGKVARDQKSSIVWVLVNGRQKWFHADSLKRQEAPDTFDPGELFEDRFNEEYS